MIDTILQGDVRSCLKQLEDESVQCVITSPPYWGLRDYGTATWEGGDPNCDHNPQKADGGARADRSLPLGRGGVYTEVCGKCGARRIDSQIGLEPTPEAYVADLVEAFREVKRVLRNDGVLWLNLGDSYCGSCSGGIEDGKAAQHGTGATVFGRDRPSKVIAGLKPKDLVGIPWMVAFALRADGWYLRSDIIWNKPNPMPESVTDRCTKSHEYIFMLTKSERYFYDADAIKETSSCLGETRIRFGGSKYGDNDDPAYATKSGNEYTDNGSRNKRDVWTVATQPCAEAHFATFPPKLIEPMILAGSKVGDTILDPFMGSGTTAIQAVRLHRHYLGCELNPEYVAMANRRITDMVGPLFAGVDDGPET